MYNFASIETIQNHLNISQNRAKQIYNLVKGKEDPQDFESVQCWVSQCFNTPRDSELILHAINEVLENFGTESIEGGECYWPRLAYSNNGDSYMPTVGCEYLNSSGTDYRFIITSTGDYVEKNNL